MYTREKGFKNFITVQNELEKGQNQGRNERTQDSPDFGKLYTAYVGYRLLAFFHFCLVSEHFQVHDMLY